MEVAKVFVGLGLLKYISISSNIRATLECQPMHGSKTTDILEKAGESQGTESTEFVQAALLFNYWTVDRSSKYHWSPSVKILPWCYGAGLVKDRMFGHDE